MSEHDRPEHSATSQPPDLLIDLAAFDEDYLSELFANEDEPFTAKALLSADRISRLVQAFVELNDFFSLTHLLTAVLVEPNPKRAKAILAETLRCMYVATRGRLPRRKSEATG